MGSPDEYWSGLLFPSPGDLPDPGIKPGSPTLQADSLPSEPSRKPIMCVLCCVVLSHSVMSDSLRTHRLQPTRLLCPWGFFRQEYWSRLPCPPPGVLTNPGIEPRSLTLQADSLPCEPPGKPFRLLKEALKIQKLSPTPTVF